MGGMARSSSRRRGACPSAVAADPTVARQSLRGREDVLLNTRDEHPKRKGVPSWSNSAISCNPRRLATVWLGPRVLQGLDNDACSTRFALSLLALLLLASVYRAISAFVSCTISKERLSA